MTGAFSEGPLHKDDSILCLFVGPPMLRNYHAVWYKSSSMHRTF